MRCVANVYVGMEMVMEIEQNYTQNENSRVVSVKLMYSQLSNADRWRYGYSAMHPNLKKLTINNFQLRY
jgi:hypothetical protein